MLRDRTSLRYLNGTAVFDEGFEERLTLPSRNSCTPPPLGRLTGIVVMGVLRIHGKLASTVDTPRSDHLLQFDKYRYLRSLTSQLLFVALSVSNGLLACNECIA